MLPDRVANLGVKMGNCTNIPEYDDDGAPLNEAAEAEDAIDTACLIAAMRGLPEPRTLDEAQEIIRQSRERVAKWAEGTRGTIFDC